MAHLSALRAFARSKAYHLPFSPQNLSTLDILYIISLILFKHLAALIGLHKPPKPSSENDGTFNLPSLTVSAPFIVTPADRQRWQLATASHDDSSGSLETSPFLPVALTTPLLLLLLASSSSSILPFGAVNTKNRFEFLRPEACRRLASSANSSRYVAVARFGGDLKGVRVKRGMEFDVSIEVIDSTKKGDDRVIFRQMISTLQFMSPKAKPMPSKEVERRDEAAFIASGDVKELKLNTQAPSRWARCCKDYNPIHMSSLAARAFGFPGKIAHGNHVVALMMESTRSTSTQSKTGACDEIWWTGDRAFFLEIAFRRPMILPITLSVLTDEGSGMAKSKPINFQVARKDKIHVTGKTGWLHP